MPRGLPFERGTLVGGRFELVSVIGRGGTSIVYGAYDHRWGEEVALKVLRRERLANRHQHEGFLAEAELALKLRHVHLLRVEEIGVEAELPYLTMRWVRGPSLRQRLRSSGALGGADTLAILRQLALGLAELHTRGFVHGDLKPENVLLDPQRGAVLIDFGIAARLRRSAAEPPNTVLGSPGYFSPEQARGERVDGRSDVYGLGLLGLELLLGRNPFSGGDIFQIVARHMVASEAMVSRFEKEVPARVWPVVRRCLAPAMSDRFATVGELIAAIDNTAKRRAPARFRPARQLIASLAALLPVAGR